jgi:hypothetical protein
MPVTAKLSRKFYDQFGDEIANELVEWFNKVDETYKSELRELNELNFARFDAGVKQQLAELRADIRSDMEIQSRSLRGELENQVRSLRGELENESRILREDIENHSRTLHEALENQGRTLHEALENQGRTLHGEIDNQSGSLRGEMVRQGEKLGTAIATLEVRVMKETLTQTRWIIGLWAAQITIFIGTVLVVLRGS